MAVPQGGKSGVDACQRRFIGAGKMGPLCQRRLLVSAASAVVVGQQRVAVRPRHKRQGTGMAEKIINGFSVVAYATQPEDACPRARFWRRGACPLNRQDAVKPSRTPRRRRRKRRRSRKAKSRRIRRPSRKSRSLSRSSSAGAFAARSRRCRPRATRWTASERGRGRRARPPAGVGRAPRGGVAAGIPMAPRATGHILLSRLCICPGPWRRRMMPHGKHRHSQSAHKEG